MSTILRAGVSKSGTSLVYGDSSYRTAWIRKQAILSGQAQKTGNIQTSTTTDAQAMKPLISEHHLTKGFTNGVQEFIIVKNPYGIF
jgi:hypothetical protein